MIEVACTLHPQVIAVLRGAHVLRPAPDLTPTERAIVEFAREADRFRAGLPHALTEAQEQQARESHVASLELVEDLDHATAHLLPDDTAELQAIIDQVMKDHGITSCLIERIGWDWLKDALAR